MLIKTSRHHYTGTTNRVSCEVLLQYLPGSRRHGKNGVVYRPTNNVRIQFFNSNIVTDQTRIRMAINTNSNTINDIPSCIECEKFLAQTTRLHVKLQYDQTFVIFNQSDFYNRNGHFAKGFAHGKIHNQKPKF